MADCSTVFDSILVRKLLQTDLNAVEPLCKVKVLPAFKFCFDPRSTLLSYPFLCFFSWCTVFLLVTSITELSASSTESPLFFTTPLATNVHMLCSKESPLGELQNSLSLRYTSPLAELVCQSPGSGGRNNGSFFCKNSFGFKSGELGRNGSPLSSRIVPDGVELYSLFTN